MKRLLLMGLFFVTSCAQAIEIIPIKQITQEELKKEQVRIEKLLYRHQVALYAVGAAAIAGAGISFYQLYKAFNPNPTFEDVENAKIAGKAKALVVMTEYLKDKQNIEINENFLTEAGKHMKEKVEVLAQERLDTFNALAWHERMGKRLSSAGKFTWGAIKGTTSAIFSVNTLKLGGKLFALGSMQYFVNNIRHYFAHPNSLLWYIGYEANYIKYCDGIINSIQKQREEELLVDKKGNLIENNGSPMYRLISSEGPLLRETLTDEDVVILQAVAEDLLISLKRMCAFMEYRMKSIAEKKQFAAQGCKQYIFNSANSWARDMSDALSAKDGKKIAQITTRLKADVTMKANMFALMDGEEDILQEILMAFSSIG